MTPSRGYAVERRATGLVLAGLVLLVVLVSDPLAGARAGGTTDGSSPSAAPAEAGEVCLALDRMALLRDALVEGSPTATTADLRRATEQVREVGARAPDLDARARAGLDFFTGLFLDLPDRPTTAQLLSAGEPAPLADQAHADALVAWLADHCGGSSAE